MKKPLKIILILLAILLVAGVAGGITISKSNIEKVTVSGNSFYSKKQIRNLIFDSKASKNTIICYLQNRFLEHKAIPFVERYQIEIKDLHNVEIIVYEKNIIGYIDHMGSYMYFDRDGVVVDSSSKVLPGVCKVEGIQFSKIILNEPMETKNKQAFDDVLVMTQIFEKENIKVKKISFDKLMHITVKVKRITVELGSGDNIDLKLAELADILPKIKKMRGTLYLDDYEPGADMAFIFKPEVSRKKKKGD